MYNAELAVFPWQ